MSELTVNEISGLQGTVKINGQVGLPAVIGANKLSVNGTIYTEGSTEVVTVPAQTYGIKIKGPKSPSTENSIIKFTSYANVERAHIAAKDNHTLLLGTSGVDRLTIDSTGKIIHKYKSLFANDSEFTDVATFSRPPTCVLEPTFDQQLANKQYVDRKFTRITETMDTYVFCDPVRRPVFDTNLSNIGIPLNAKHIHGHIWRDVPQGPDFVFGSVKIGDVKYAERRILGVYAHGEKDGTGTFNEFILPCAKYIFPNDNFETRLYWYSDNTQNNGEYEDKANLDGTPYAGTGVAILGYWI